MLYLKEDEFTQILREKGFVILNNEPLADHYFELLSGAFRDLRIVKSTNEQILYTQLGVSCVQERLNAALDTLISHVKCIGRMLAEVESSSLNFMRMGENDVKRSVSG